MADYRYCRSQLSFLREHHHRKDPIVTDSSAIQRRALRSCRANNLPYGQACLQAVKEALASFRMELKRSGLVTVQNRFSAVWAAAAETPE